jgi:hypothetical protein
MTDRSYPNVARHDTVAEHKNQALEERGAS